MIRIDNILFGFTAADEQFVNDLYADWNSFCHTCVEEVIEKSLSVYDKEKVLYELELLDLDLGSIPEENIYQEFPRRLREELQRALPLLNISTGNREENTSISRLENLLFYLEYGYPKIEWRDESFNLTEELEWIATQPPSYINKISKLCLSKENALRRLFWQTDNEEVFFRLFTIALSEPTASLHEKRRFLVMLLETKPDIPVHFIHKAENEAALLGMAELLDTVSVRRIMETETGEHTEVDLPPYWHYLYEWLIRYYPFKGLAIFGGKGDFIRHLHHRLLTFINKQTYSFYFSKADLTIGFLLEVFGSTYYIEVLNAIYDLQPHNPDGSPVHDSYSNRELYRIFLSLSLLRLPLAEEREKMPSSKKEENRYLTDISTLTAFLKDTQRSDADKRMLVALFARKNPKRLIAWLQTEAVKEDVLISILTEITDIVTIYRLLASVSFTAIEIVEQMRSYLRSDASKPGWLDGVTGVRLDFAIRKAVLFWIGNECQSEPEADNIRQLLRWIYRIITNNDNEDAVELLSTELCLAEKRKKNWEELAEDHKATYIQKLRTILADGNIPETVKRRMIALFLEQYTGNYTDAILLLYKENLLSSVVHLISQPALEEIIRRSVIRMDGEYLPVGMLPLLYWLLDHESVVSVYLQDRTTGLKVQLLVWLAKTVQSPHSLLTALFVKENIHSVIAGIFEESDSNITQTLLESSWNTDKGFINWLEDMTVSTKNKRELLQKIAVEKPLYWIHLLRQQPIESKVIPLLSVSLSASWLLQSMARVDSRQASVLSQTVEWIQNKLNDYPFLTGRSIVYSTALSQALLLYMQDAETLGGRRLTEKETVHKFLSYLHLVYTGKSNYQDRTEWVGLSGMITASMHWKTSQDITSIIEKQPEQMEDYFLSRLFMKNNTGFLPVEKLSDKDLPENIRKKLLYRYIRFQPKELLDYINRSVERNILPLDKWLVLLDLNDWMRLATNLSLSQAELLQQIIDCLSENGQAKKADLQQALAVYLIENIQKWIYNSKEEAVHSFVQLLPTLQEKAEIERKEIEHNVKQILNIMEGKSYLEEQKEVPTHFSIANAGLCLFSPWFPQLFSMVGYLTEERRTFKDTASQIRAVFLLQYLACLEEKEYRETDLVFNRLLVALPMHIPLPKQIELTQREKDVIESLQKAIRVNWAQMRDTSALGFLKSFVLRNGRLEQQEEKWQLTVEERGIDVLLDTVPWSFKLIRFPWLEKRIQVVWHEKQQF